MTTERRFPMLYADKRPPHAPTSIPWSFIAPYEGNAERNHGQSLELLAERGGLHPGEVFAIVHGLRWGCKIGDDEAIAWLNKAVQERYGALH